MCSRSGTRRTSRRDAWPTLSGTIGAVSGTSRPTHQKQYKVNVFLLNIDFLVVGAAKCVAGMGRGAHRARTFGRTLVGGPALPVKKHYKVNVFLVNIDFLVVDAV